MMIDDICNAKREELLALPQKPFSEERIYEYIVIVPTKRTHDSGWRLMALIGATKVDNNKYRPTELIGYCDDINWILPENKNNSNSIIEKYKHRIRTDMTLSNCIRMWSYNHVFKVGCCTSSVDITIIKANE
jgi:hypothetical protein